MLYRQSHFSHDCIFDLDIWPWPLVNLIFFIFRSSNRICMQVSSKFNLPFMIYRQQYFRNASLTMILDLMTLTLGEIVRLININHIYEFNPDPTFCPWLAGELVFTFMYWDRSGPKIPGCLSVCVCVLVSVCVSVCVSVGLCVRTSMLKLLSRFRWSLKKMVLYTPSGVRLCFSSLT